MTMTGVPSFDKTVQKTQVWLDDLARELGWEDRHRVYRVLRVTLHLLRDRLPLNESVQFGAQLPMLIRGLYYEGWRPSDTPNKSLDRQEFLTAIKEALADQPEVDAGHVCRAAFRVLEKHISRGESQDIADVLPKRLRTLWNEAVWM
jgi:uncharacterized protein (DUF2267 family)